jgi:hypothetical protein
MPVFRQVVVTAMHIWLSFRWTVRQWKRITRVVLLRGSSCRDAHSGMQVLIVNEWMVQQSVPVRGEGSGRRVDL